MDKDRGDRGRRDAGGARYSAETASGTSYAVRAIEPEENPVAGLRGWTGCFEVQVPEIPAGRKPSCFIAYYDRYRGRLIGELAAGGDRAGDRDTGAQGTEASRKLVSLGLDEPAREWVETWKLIWSLQREVEREERIIREDAAPISLALILFGYYLQDAEVSYIREATAEESAGYVYPVRPEHPIFTGERAAAAPSAAFEIPSWAYSPTAQSLASRSGPSSETDAPERRLEEETHGASRVIPISEEEREQIWTDLALALARRRRVQHARQGISHGGSRRG